jgi:hypothetical protein
MLSKSSTGTSSSGLGLFAIARTTLRTPVAGGETDGACRLVGWPAYPRVFLLLD